jgi:hypothetical protein
MLPLALAPMLRSVLVRMPRQAQAVPSVMEPVMGPAMGQETKGSDLKMAPALDLRNNALDPPTFDIGTGADSYIGDCPSLFIEFHSLAKGILIPIASLSKFGILSPISARRQLCGTCRN